MLHIGDVLLNQQINQEIALYLVINNQETIETLHLNTTLYALNKVLNESNKYRK